MTQMEKQFITYIETQAYDQAKALLDANDSLIDAPGSAEVASAVALYLLMNEEYDSCAAYGQHYLKTLPSADLYFNTAYAHECLGNTLLAIEYYQCARLYTLDADLRAEAHLKIQTLRYSDLSEADFECLLQYKSEERSYILAQLQSPSTLIDPNLYMKTKLPHMERQVFILLGTMEIANHIAHYLNHFRGQGFDVFGINYVPSYLEYDCDFSHSLEALSGEAALNHYMQNAADLIGDYDVFHFLFNKTLMPNASDIIPLKVLKKAVFMHGLGSEIRTPSIARAHHPYWAYAEDYLAQLNESVITQNLKALSHWIDHGIVNDYEMKSYVEGYYKNLHMIGLPIDLNKYPFVGVSESKTITVVHAPTNKSVKGSKYFEAALAQLKDKYDIRYHRVEQTTHENAMKIYSQADVILDELIIGTYGSLTIECMAMGKCVCTFINPGFKTPHNEPIPVWSVTVDNVVDRLDALFASLEERKALSKAARSYVERNNDISKIGIDLLKIYQKALSQL